MADKERQDRATPFAPLAVVGAIGLVAAIGSILIEYWLGAVGGLVVLGWALYLVLGSRLHLIRRVQDRLATAPTSIVIALAFLVAGVAAVAGARTVELWVSLLIAGIPLVGLILWAVFYREREGSR